MERDNLWTKYTLVNYFLVTKPSMSFWNISLKCFLKYNMKEGGKEGKKNSYIYN